MKLVSFEHDERLFWGHLESNRIIAPDESVLTRFPTLGAALGGGYFDTGQPKLFGPFFPFDAVRLLPPLPDPGKIICVGRNFGAHVAEAGLKQPDFPSLFIRFTDTLVASGEALVRPAISDQFDFEGEVAIIIGTAGRHIPEGKALDHIFGYSIFNDGSIRDVQIKHSLAAGKNFYRSGGFGPSITTADEISDYRDLVIKTRVNGETVQHAPLADMIFNVECVLAYISRFTPLSPGDMILTGTPEGVGMARIPPLWLKPGDCVEVEVAPLGILVNPIIAEEVLAR